MIKVILFTVLALMSTAVGFARDNSNVTVYSAVWCDYCHKAKNHLDDRGVSYKDCDVDKDASCKAEFDRLKGVGLPLIMVGGDRMDGYDRAELDALLKKHGLI